MKRSISKTRIGKDIVKTILRVKFLKKRIPLYCEWEITSHCNMQCRYCSTLLSDRNKLKDVSTVQAREIIKQLASLGTRLLHFSGGEPTLRDDLAELITEAQNHGMIVTFTTNGSASPEKLRAVAHADIIRVSIDGTEEFHDTLRNAPGSYAKAIQAIGTLKEAGNRPLITTVYTDQTTYEMMETLCATARDLGVQVAINVIGRNVNADADDPKESNDLSLSVFTAFRQDVKRLTKKYRRVVANPEPLITIIKKGGLDVYGCRAMDIAIAVKHDGSVGLPCNGLSLLMGSGNIKELYYSKEAAAIRPQQGRHRICKGCYIKCMCSASSLLTIRGILAIMSSYRHSLRKS